MKDICTKEFSLEGKLCCLKHMIYFCEACERSYNMEEFYKQVSHFYNESYMSNPYFLIIANYEIKFGLFVSINKLAVYKFSLEDHLACANLLNPLANLTKILKDDRESEKLTYAIKANIVATNTEKSTFMIRDLDSYISFQQLVLFNNELATMEPEERKESQRVNALNLISHLIIDKLKVAF